MNQDELKKSVALAAVEYCLPRIQTKDIVGIGTGSTADFFIDALAEHKHKFQASVASSEASADRLRSHGIQVLDMNDIDRIAIYVDGADETNADLELIKGGGAALTREKIVCAVADTFVCIADESKWVDTLGKFPLPVEVIPMARRQVAQALKKLGGEPKYREGVVTDNGCQILDVYGMNIHNPVELEERINHITGVVTNGLFARKGADILLLGTQSGVKTITKRAQD